LKKFIPYLFCVIVFYSCANSSKNTKQADTNNATDSTVAGITDLSSIKEIPVLLCQNWVYKTDAEDYDSSNGTLDIPYRGLSFFTDSTVVKEPHEDMLFGKWSFNNDDKTIHVNYDNGKKEEYKIKAIGPKDLTLIKLNDDKEEIIFVADGKQEQNCKDDSYHFTNNHWRIKPKHAETDEEIKERLKQCIWFYVLFFNDDIKRSSSTILFHGLPSCFNWYNGGIGLQHKDELDPKWINCFYDKDQAMQAYKLMGNLIEKKYQWDKNETNWVKQTAPVLQQMYDSLK
jgi:hypothetical protein